ncbi:MAG: hypothetical protein F6J87_04325 [Spirulina sp. SIO3F2]|nr:hypothetical protein [Spirulina sp. SIO3F2]
MPVTPTIDAVYTIAPQVIGLQIKEGELELAQQQPYQPQLGDRRLENEHNPNYPVRIQRQGRVIGSLVGPEEDVIYGFDRFVGKPLNLEWADDRFHYQISSPDDSNYHTTQFPTAVFRKTKPSDRGETRQGLVWPLEHRLYLELPTALQPDKTYHLEFSGQVLPTQRWRYQPQQQWSEAVHVSQIGFRPDDLVKVAFLSAWLGSGGGWNYPEQLPFTVVNDRNNKVVYRGKAQLNKLADAPEDARDRNYTHADVYALRFDRLQQPGRYRVCVAGVGCSDPFRIAADVWQDAFQLSMQGFLAQRSGVEFQPPEVAQRRPRPFHPDDTPIYQSTTSLMQTTMGIGPQNVFKSLARTGTQTSVPEAWGGYFDAGDWDRRIQHLEATRLLLELFELFPEQLTTTQLQIPEARNSLPDLLDEALWNLDFYRRLQESDGGIRGGVESVDHPRRGEASWQNSLPTYAYAADPWSSYLYAATAAQAAEILQAVKPKLAKVYRQSAIAAMDYAETHPPYALPNRPHHIDDARNLAAAQLYRLTQDPQYHEIFLATTVFKQPSQFPWVWGQHGQAEAAFLYARLPDEQTNLTVQIHARNALLRDGDRAVEVGQKTAFNWSKDEPYQPLGWGGSLGTPKAIHLLRAHALTQNEKYLKAAVLAAQFSAGANPINMAFTTGLGDRSPQNPLVIDTRVTAQAPPPGITVYGPLDVVRFQDYWIFEQLHPYVFPELFQWPTAEAYFDVFLFPAATEFTIMETMAPTAYTWGYLALRQSE